MGNQALCCGSVESKDSSNATNDNKAFVFIKPHAVTDKTKELVVKELMTRGIKIVSQGDIKGSKIDQDKLIDQHYYAIASKATLLEPKDLPVPTDKFKSSFGVEWKEAVSSGQAMNALQAMDYYGLDGKQLESEWRKNPATKFGGGFYCAKVDSVSGKDTKFVFNAFFMNMRAAFVAPNASIYYYSVEWPSSKLSWKSFRGDVLGPTNPANAPVDSIRGKILAQWQDLGLPGAPDGSENGVHASASPFEGLAERCNWLASSFDQDPFGAQLLAAGLKESELREWSVDPRVMLPGKGEEGSVFDALEDTDNAQCAELLLGIQKVNS